MIVTAVDIIVPEIEVVWASWLEAVSTETVLFARTISPSPLGQRQEHAGKARSVLETPEGVCICTVVGKAPSFLALKWVRDWS